MLLLLGGYWTCQGQSIQLTGYTLDSALLPIPNSLIFAEVFDPNGTLVGWDSLSSDLNGNYQFAFPFPIQGVDSGTLRVYSFDGCIGQNAEVQHIFSIGQTLFSDTLIVCGVVPSPTCIPSFQQRILTYPTFEFEIDTTLYPAGTYFWKFGDGATANGPKVQHTYLTDTVFSVCVLYTNANQGCLDSSCQIVTLPPLVPCQAGFEYEIASGPSVKLVTTSVGVPPFDYQWTVTNGFSSSLPSPTLTITDTAFYGFGLEIVDAVNCKSSYQESFWVPYDTNTCKALFTQKILSNLVHQFTATFQEPNRAFSWDISDGFRAIGPSIDHSFAAPDTYTVCLTMIDTVDLCQDKRCQRIIVRDKAQCHAHFAWQKVGPDSIQMLNLSQTTGDFRSFSWTFGDGQTSNAFSPGHTYTGTGPWNACLVIESDTGLCMDTSCREVDLDLADLYSLSGVVTFSNIPLKTAKARLYQYNGQEFELQKPGSLSFNVYDFDSLNSGGYLVWVREPEVEDAVPAYLGGDIFWEDGINSIITQRNVVNPNLPLPTLVPAFGTALAEGRMIVTQGPTYDDWVLILLNDRFEPVRYAYPDAQGKYAFSNLAYGTYWLHAERPSSFVSPVKIVLNAAQPANRQANIELQGSFGFPVGLEQSLVNIPTMYVEQEQLMVETQRDGGHTLTLYNMGGQVLRTHTFLGRETTLSLGPWPAGVYIARLTSDHASPVFVRWNIAE